MRTPDPANSDHAAKQDRPRAKLWRVVANDQNGTGRRPDDNRSGPHERRVLTGENGTRALQDLPQICHKPKQTEKENGGFMRVTAGRYLWQKTGKLGELLRNIPISH